MKWNVILFCFSIILLSIILLSLLYQKFSCSMFCSLIIILLLIEFQMQWVIIDVEMLGLRVEFVHSSVRWFHIDSWELEISKIAMSTWQNFSFKFFCVWESKIRYTKLEIQNIKSLVYDKPENLKQLTV